MAGSQPTSECLLPNPRCLQGPCGPLLERNQSKRVATGGFNSEGLIFQWCPDLLVLGEERLASKRTRIDFLLPEPHWFSVTDYFGWSFTIVIFSPSFYKLPPTRAGSKCGGYVKVNGGGYHFKLDADCDVPRNSMRQHGRLIWCEFQIQAHPEVEVDVILVLDKLNWTFRPMAKI